MLQVYILTKGTLQCGTWSQLSPSAAKRFHSCIIELYRDVSGHYYGNRQDKQVISDDDLLYQYELMSPETIIRIARLSLFCRICIKAPDPLRNLVKDMHVFCSGWTASVVSDLKWLQLDPAFESGNGFSVEEWVKYVAEYPRTFKKLISKFARTRIANLHTETIVTDRDASIPSGCLHSCNLCSFQANTLQKLSLHLFKHHHIRNMWRHYIGTRVHCSVCLKLFWTRERLLNHIRYKSKVCQKNLLLRGPICSEEEALAADSECLDSNKKLYSESKRRHYVVEPVLQLSGPTQFEVLLPESSSAQHRLGRGHNYYGASSSIPT